VSVDVEADDAPDDEGPLLPWIEPDDRLWRHPSEVGAPAPVRMVSTPRMMKPSGTRTWSVAVVAGVVGAIIASGVGAATGTFERQTTVVQWTNRAGGPPSSVLSTGSGASPDWPAIADQVAPSVVAIAAMGSRGSQSGSGVLYTSIGDRSYILTAANLIGDGRIEVTLDDSETQFARLVGVDRQTGVGLLSVPNGSRSFPTFTMAGDLKVAEPVLAVGAHSAGISHAPVVSGSISALDAAINVGDSATMENLVAMSTSGSVSIDAGGALVDQRGAVFGIEAMIDSPDVSAAGQSFAIPMDVAAHVVRQMIGGQTVTHPWLGTVGTTDPSTATARQFHLAGGAQVAAVMRNSPAQRVGLVPSDIITSFNGHTVVSTGALTWLVHDCDIGRQASISYLHKGKPVSATVTLVNTPTDVNLG